MGNRVRNILLLRINMIFNMMTYVDRLAKKHNKIKLKIFWFWKKKTCIHFIKLVWSIYISGNSINGVKITWLRKVIHDGEYLDFVRGDSIRKYHASGLRFLGSGISPWYLVKVRVWNKKYNYTSKPLLFIKSFRIKCSEPIEFELIQSYDLIISIN